MISTEVKSVVFIIVGTEQFDCDSYGEYIVAAFSNEDDAKYILSQIENLKLFAENVKKNISNICIKYETENPPPQSLQPNRFTKYGTAHFIEYAMIHGYEKLQDLKQHLDSVEDWRQSYDLWNNKRIETINNYKNELEIPADLLFIVEFLSEKSEADIGWLLNSFYGVSYNFEIKKIRFLDKISNA